MGIEAIRTFGLGLAVFLSVATPALAQRITIVGTQHPGALGFSPDAAQLAHDVDRQQDESPPFSEPDLTPVATERVAELQITGGKWFEGLLGLIGAETVCQASHAAAEMRATRDSFTEHFQAPSTSVAVVDRSLAQHADALRAAGMAGVMPWPLACPSSATADLEQPAGRGDGSESSGLRHELGHLLFIHGLWPGSGDDSEYGGGAPDWLDEAAAIAVESHAVTAGRRDAFAALVARDDLIALDEYFSMPHPRMANTELRALIEKMRERVESGEEHVVAQADPSVLRGGRMTDFYAQSRGLIDFLVERSGDRKILMVITRALRKGSTIEQWLAEDGRGLGLPANIRELERQFRVWARTPYEP